MDDVIERILFRPAEVGVALGISRSRAYELIAKGDIPSVLVGGCVRVPVDALKASIDRQIAERGATAI